MRPRAPSALAIAALTATLLAVPVQAHAFTHVVAPGETLSSVAATDGLSVEALAAANGLSIESQLIAGSGLVIPEQGSTAVEVAEPSAEGPASSSGTGGGYVVEPGDTLSAIAARDGTSVEALASANGLDPAGLLLAGIALSLPGAASEGAETSAGETSSSGEGAAYVVQPGDTLSAIAARDGTTVEALASANGLDPTGLILAGVALSLPGAASEAAATGEGETPTSEAPPYPTEETVSASEVAAIAEEHGISPSLAEAVADQESGFNNRFTSSADGRGVMQIIPSTWSYIVENLAGEPPLEPASASSNVRGGVLLLRQLLNESGGDPAGAVAGYYQGIESVREHGRYPDTEQYVANVLALQSRFAGE